MLMGAGTLAGLPIIRNYQSKRISSWDREGRNRDYWRIEPGERRDIAVISGPRCVKHIWVTMGSSEPAFPRKVVLRAWWDGESTPSIECPIGDFFGLGHGLRKNFTSLPLCMSPQDGKAFNCFWPMPFAEGARFEVHSECDQPFALYFYVDYEAYSEAPGEDVGRLHAQWRRQNPTDGWTAEPGADPEQVRKEDNERVNLDGAGN